MSESAIKTGNGIESEKEVTKITKQEFDAMAPAQQNNVLLAMTKIEGTAVVRGADGRIRYDDETLKGTYGE